VYTRDFGTMRSAVWIADGDGRRTHRLAAGNFGVISPQGDVVAIDRGENDVYLVRSDGSGERLLARHLKPYLWAPDGRTLLVYNNRRLFSLDVRSGRRTLLVRGRSYGASVSPDSRAVVVAVAARRDPTGGCAEQVDLHVIRLDGGGEKQITHDGHSALPLWGPRHITFSRILSSCVSPSLWRMRPDGSRLRPILARTPSRFTSNGYYGLSPLGWLADWKRLVLGVRSEWGNEAVVLHVPSGRLRWQHRFVDDVAADGTLVGTQGGAEGPYSILIFRASGGRSRLIAHGSVCCADWNR
jgi:Tol biopolymer transport system component